MSDDERLPISESIRELDFTVTAADVANLTGLPLATGYFHLNRLAQAGNAHLKVTEPGSVDYCFSAHSSIRAFGTGSGATVNTSGI